MLNRDEIKEFGEAMNKTLANDLRNKLILAGASILICHRCGNGSNPAKPWIQRRPQPPKQCWACNSPYWQTPRRAKKAA